MIEQWACERSAKKAEIIIMKDNDLPFIPPAAFPISNRINISFGFC